MWVNINKMYVSLTGLLFCVCIVKVSGVPTPAAQRFQANTFLDMLGKTFDPKVAYTDLLTELTQRLNIDLTSSSNISSQARSKHSTSGSEKSCTEAPKLKGVTITYNNDVHVVGSRAFYECETGYDGMSKFIYCTQGGQWSSLGDWAGCSPVDCGLIPPNVQNADHSIAGSSYGSVVLYNCHDGYKLDKPNANVTCLATGFWEKPTFTCEKAASPSLRLPSLQKAFNKNMGVHKIQQLQQLATTLLGAGPSSTTKSSSRQIQPLAAIKKLSRTLRSLRTLTPPQPPDSSSPSLSSSNNSTAVSSNPMMEAFFKSVQAFQGLPGLPTTGSAPNTLPVPSASNFANNPMAAMFAQMFPNFTPPPPQTTTTTTTAKPAVKSPLGFQLPSHLQSLLPNGLSSTAGIRPQDLMTLASMGLGSSNSAAAPRDITQLLGTMNPMSIFGGSMGMGLGMGGLTPRAGGAAAGPGAAAPLEPEKVVEQREEMMMRAMMASAMKSMMGPGPVRNGTAAPVNRNPAMDMMTLMALQSGLSGGSGGGGGGGAVGMDPLSMMMGGLGGGGGGGGGLFGSLFGAA